MSNNNYVVVGRRGVEPRNVTGVGGIITFSNYPRFMES